MEYPEMFTVVCKESIVGYLEVGYSPETEGHSMGNSCVLYGMDIAIQVSEKQKSAVSRQKESTGQLGSSTENTGRFW